MKILDFINILAILSNNNKAKKKRKLILSKKKIQARLLTTPSRFIT